MILFFFYLNYVHISVLFKCNDQITKTSPKIPKVF